METDYLKAIICDLDGTLCDDDHRRPVVTGDGWGQKEYDDYYAHMHKDTPFNHVREILHRFEEDHTILFVTGRPDRFKDITLDWIDEHTDLDLDNYNLIMRPDGDYRCDTVIKTELYKTLIMPKYNVLFVLEDRTRVVKMWRDLGIPCLQVQQSDF